MSSSSAGSGVGRSRIIHAGSPGAPGADALRPPSVSVTTGTADRSGHAAVLRGRRPPPATERGPGGREGAAGPAFTNGSPKFGPGAAIAPEVAAELRELQRIAEERGYNAGRSRAVAELEAAIEAAGSLATRLEALAPRETTTVAHAIAELALAIARRVVESELHIEPTILVHALESAISSINGSPEAHVLLNPAVVDRVRVAWEASHGLAYLGKHWTFEADPSLPVGGCILRYEHGFVDAGLEAQIEEIGIALDGAIPAFWRDDAEAGAA